MRRECETYFQTLLWLSDAASTLGFSKGETWVLGNVCLRWRVGSSLVSAEICAPSVSTVAFSSVVALAQEHPHTARARIGRAAKLSGVAAGWLGLRAHTGWAGLQCWLRIVLNGSINTPLERAEGTTWEPPEHLFSAGFHLKSQRLNCANSAAPVLQFSGGKLLAVSYTRPDFSSSAFSLRLFKEHITWSSCFAPQNQLQGTQQQYIGTQPSQKKAASCWSCTNTSKDLESLMPIAEYFCSPLNQANAFIPFLLTIGASCLVWEQGRGNERVSSHLL